MGFQPLPDVPRWVETRAMMQSQRARIEYDANGIVVSDRLNRLTAVVGQPSFETILVETRMAEEVLCSVEDRDWVGTALEDWDSEIVTLYTLPNFEHLDDSLGEVTEITDPNALVHLEDALRKDIELAMRNREVLGVEVDGQPVSFAYAAWTTEGFFEVSVDTSEAFRRRGLARAAVSALIRRHSASGRRAVWGAVDSNPGSHEFARSLGFVETDRIAVFTRGS